MPRPGEPDGTRSPVAPPPSPRPRRLARGSRRAVGVECVPEILRWEPGPREETSRWDGGSFHENPRSTDGLEPQKVRQVDIARAPDRVRAAYASVIAHREHLRAFRLREGFRPPGTREERRRSDQSGQESPRRSCHSASDSSG